MTIIKKNIELMLLVLMSLMAINYVQAESIKENLLEIKAAPEVKPIPEILPVPIRQTRVAQLGCKYDRKLKTLVYLFVTTGFAHLATEEEKDVLEFAENDFAPKSCAQVLMKFVNAGYSEKSATTLGEILIINLYKFGFIKPIPLPSAR